MSDEKLDQPQWDMDTGKPWMPSASLHSSLLLGMLAVLLSGGLSVTASFLTLAQGKILAQQGFTVADGLSLASNVAILVVMLVYFRLGKEVDSPGLKKTSLALFLAGLTGVVLEFADTEIFPNEVAFPAAVAGAGGLVGLLIFTFTYSGRQKPPTPQEAATESSDTAKAGAGLGGLGILLLIALKIGGRALFRKGGLGLGFEELVPIAWVALVVLSLVYLIWFAVAKIRLQDKLGVVARVLGITEILICLTLIGLLVPFMVEVFGIVTQPNLNDQQMDQAINDLREDWGRYWLTAHIVTDLVWTFLTAFLFVMLRTRYEPDWAEATAT